MWDLFWHKARGRSWSLRNMKWVAKNKNFPAWGTAFRGDVSSRGNCGCPVFSELQDGFWPLPSVESPGLPTACTMSLGPASAARVHASYVHWFMLPSLRPQIHQQAPMLPESVKGSLWLHFIHSLVQTSDFSCERVVWNKTSLLDSLSLPAPLGSWLPVS